MIWYNNNMNNPLTLNRSADYQDMIDSTGYLEDQDFNPIIVDDIFTEDQLNHIYSVVQATPLYNLKVAPWGGQCSWKQTEFRKDIIDRVNEIGLQVLGDKAKLQHDYSFVRYSEEYGYKTKLFPHQDKRERPRFLLDIQLRADETWGIVVEETTYYLKNNQGIFFSGTNQQHWREQKNISPHSRIDMMFCNFEFTDGRIFPENYNEIAQKRSVFLRQKYNLDDTPLIVDRKINELL